LTKLYFCINHGIIHNAEDGFKKAETCSYVLLNCLYNKVVFLTKLYFCINHGIIHNGDFSPTNYRVSENDTDKPQFVPEPQGMRKCCRLLNDFFFLKMINAYISNITS
jgi:hypothetical protein